MLLYNFRTVPVSICSLMLSNRHSPQWSSRNNNKLCVHLTVTSSKIQFKIMYDLSHFVWKYTGIPFSYATHTRVVRAQNMVFLQHSSRTLKCTSAGRTKQ